MESCDDKMIVWRSSAGSLKVPLLLRLLDNDMARPRLSASSRSAISDSDKSLSGFCSGTKAAWGKGGSWLLFSLACGSPARSSTNRMLCDQLKCLDGAGRSVR